MNNPQQFLTSQFSLVNHSFLIDYSVFILFYHYVFIFSEGHVQIIGRCSVLPLIKKKFYYISSRIFDNVYRQIDIQHQTVFLSAKNSKVAIRDLQHQVFRGKRQTANRKMSRDHGLAVTFAVCTSRLNRRKGFQRYVIYGKVFCHKKNLQPHV